MLYMFFSQATSHSASPSFPKTTRTTKLLKSLWELKQRPNRICPTMRHDGFPRYVHQGAAASISLRSLNQKSDKEITESCGNPPEALPHNSWQSWQPCGFNYGTFYKPQWEKATGNAACTKDSSFSYHWNKKPGNGSGRQELGMDCAAEHVCNNYPGCVGGKELSRIKLALFPTALLISGEELKFSPLSSDRSACCTAVTHAVLGPSVGTCLFLARTAN